MITQNLSRKDKRALISKVGRQYGLKGDAALSIHNAYLTMQNGDIPGALRLAHPVTQSHPDNPHAWILLGSAALSQREGSNARAFFAKAVSCAPRNARALAGLGKAHVLCAEVEPGVEIMQQAIEAGSREPALLQLYLTLMIKLDRRIQAADTLEPLLPRIDSADLAANLAEALLAMDETGRAANCLERAHACAPDTLASRTGLAQAHLYRLRLDEAETLARALLAEGPNDQAAIVLISALRLQRRHREALELADSHDFTTPEALAAVRGMAGNLLQDLGEDEAAEAAYQEAMHIAGEQPHIQKSYGTFLFRAGRYDAGQPYFAKRILKAQRRALSERAAAPESLAAQDRLFIRAEQGVGDQVALMALLRAAPLRPGAKVSLIAEPRMRALLQDNDLGLQFLSETALAEVAPPLAPEETLLLGDLVRYLPEHFAAPERRPYLRPDEAQVAAIRARYAARAEGRPVLGLAWASRSIVGVMRSIPLPEMVQTLPEGAMVVSLQYGDTREEIAAARQARPDLLFFSDPEIDQMADLAGFAAQIAALDQIVTIDNTTAHMAGALGHARTHLLLPKGTECMWYWGASGSRDPWYGKLHLYRQSEVGAWAAPLAALGAAL